MKLIPSERQLKYLDWEFGVFLHFGIRTFYHGHRDWDLRPMEPEAFNPDSLCCDQWVSEAKLAGAKYAVLTTKHHDGFALWQSAYTDYSVKASPWKDGKGDVVREFTDACHRNGIGCGLYYSAAQWRGGADFSDAEHYDDYVVGQISELLGNYGKIDYLWFDACFSDKHKYNGAKITAKIRELQPDILVFGMFDPDVYGVGNEDGYPDMRQMYVKTIKRDGKTETRFLVTEGDARIRDSWFYDLNGYSVKSPEELFGMYEMTVGRGSSFLLNLGPDTHGLLCEDDLNALHTLSDNIKRRYSRPLPFSGIYKEADGRLAISYPEEYYKRHISDTVNLPLVRRVVIKEDIKKGESVKGWRLYATIPSKYPYSDWGEFCLCEGRGIGHKHICMFPAMRAPRFRLEITDSDGEYSISGMEAFE